MKLDLSDNPMTEEVGTALAEALRGQHSLQVLNLNDTALGDAGIESIAEVKNNLCANPHAYQNSVFCCSV